MFQLRWGLNCWKQPKVSAAASFFSTKGTHCLISVGKLRFAQEKTCERLDSPVAVSHADAVSVPVLAPSCRLALGGCRRRTKRSGS